MCTDEAMLETAGTLDEDVRKENGVDVAASATELRVMKLRRTVVRVRSLAFVRDEVPYGSRSCPTGFDATMTVREASAHANGCTVQMRRIEANGAESDANQRSRAEPSRDVHANETRERAARREATG